MTWLLYLLAAVVLLFGSVVLFGAPYLPTLSRQQQQALDLLNLRPGQTLVELGSGDGRMLKAAAERGIYAIGYELNPLLVVYSWLVTRRHRGLVRVRLGNFWRLPLPDCDGVYVFLLDRYMAKLDDKLQREGVRPLRLVSFAFRIPGKTASAQKNGLYLYKYDHKKSEV